MWWNGFGIAPPRLRPRCGLWARRGDALRFDAKAAFTGDGRIGTRSSRPRVLTADTVHSSRAPRLAATLSARQTPWVVTACPRTYIAGLAVLSRSGYTPACLAPLLQRPVCAAVAQPTHRPAVGAAVDSASPFAPSSSSLFCPPSPLRCHNNQVPSSPRPRIVHQQAPPIRHVAAAVRGSSRRPHQSVDAASRFFPPWTVFPAVAHATDVASVIRGIRPACVPRPLHLECLTSPPAAHHHVQFTPAQRRPGPVQARPPSPPRPLRLVRDKSPQPRPVLI